MHRILHILPCLALVFAVACDDDPNPPKKTDDKATPVEQTKPEAPKPTEATKPTEAPKPTEATKQAVPTPPAIPTPPQSPPPVDSSLEGRPNPVDTIECSHGDVVGTCRESCQTGEDQVTSAICPGGYVCCAVDAPL